MHSSVAIPELHVTVLATVLYKNEFIVWPWYMWRKKKGNVTLLDPGKEPRAVINAMSVALMEPRSTGR